MSSLKLYHYILAIIFSLVCAPIFVSYGWIFFATFTGRPGLNGNMYIYYDLTSGQFALYNFIIALLAAVFPALFLILIVKKKASAMKLAFIYFGVYVALIIFCESILASRFTGKG